MNYQGLLEACVVGKLVEGEPPLPNLPSPAMEPSKKGMLYITQIVEETQLTEAVGHISVKFTVSCLNRQIENPDNHVFHLKIESILRRLTCGFVGTIPHKPHSLKASAEATSIK